MNISQCLLSSTLTSLSSSPHSSFHPSAFKLDGESAPPKMTLSNLATAALSNYQVVGWHHLYILVAAVTVLSTVAGVFILAFWKPKMVDNVNDVLVAFARFFYASFLKPHSADESAGQQAALESFYKAQVRLLAY